MRSLQDSIATAELRLDNYERAKKNAQFVTIELDRIESKIQALAEMAVNRQDPDLISSQVDSAAESMRQTEKAVSELQHLTGLADELQDPPAILDADCDRYCDMTPDTAEERSVTGADVTKSGSAVGALSDLPSSFPPGRSSWPSSTSRARRRRSCCTATPTTSCAAPAATEDEFVGLAEFLAEQLFGRWELVLHYDLGRGLRVAAGRDDQRLKEMVTLANRKVGDLSTLSKDPSATIALLDRFVRNNLMAAEADRLSLAVIVDQASYVFPSGDPGRLSAQARRSW